MAIGQWMREPSPTSTIFDKRETSTMSIDRFAQIILIDGKIAITLFFKLSLYFLIQNNLIL